MRLRCAFGLLIVVSVAACDGHRAKPAPPPGPSAKQLEAKALVTTDLPAVYASAPADPTGVDTNLKDCHASSSPDGVGRLTTARTAFHGASGANDIHEVISSYAPGAAHLVIEKARALLQTCAHFSEKQSGITTTETLTPLAFPALLDETFAMRASAQAGTTALSFDEVFMRSGDLLVELVHGGVGTVDIAISEDLARRAATKVAAP